MESCTIWEERFRSHFWFLDVNRDGGLSRADFEKMALKMTSAYNADEALKNKCIKVYLGWWLAEYEPLSVDGKLPEKGFIDALTSDFSELTKFKENLNKSFNVVFDVIDHNQDGLVSQEEFVIYFTAFNVKDKDVIKEIFARLDVDNTGIITRDVWLAANENYFTLIDETLDHGFLYNIPLHAL